LTKFIYFKAPYICAAGPEGCERVRNELIRISLQPQREFHRSPAHTNIYNVK